MRADGAALADARAHDHGGGPRSVVHGSQPAGLVEKDLPPSEHLVDAAYIDAELLVSSHKDYGITLRGPARPNPIWQAKVEGGYTLADFVVDWERQQVHCP